MSLFLKPKDSHSSRLICDLRPLNRLYPTCPSKFSLQSISWLLATTRWWNHCFFTKLDITAYFHSLSLHPCDLIQLRPPGMGYLFTFNYHEQFWHWLRLHFGWSWAPAINQRQMEQLVKASLVVFPDVLGLVYYDDVLLACSSPDRLSAATSSCVEYLRQHNSC